LISLAGWMNQRHLRAIDYLREENRVLREQLGDRRLRLTDDQRRRLAAKAKALTAGRGDRVPPGRSRLWWYAWRKRTATGANAQRGTWRWSHVERLDYQSDPFPESSSSTDGPRELVDHREHPRRFPARRRSCRPAPRPWTRCSLCIGGALGGFWGYPSR
jgi:hypothetical protein